MKFKFSKETIMSGLKITGKIGKAVVIEGVKGVLLKSAAKAITTSFDGGIEGVKQLTIDDYIGSKKKRNVVSEVNAFKSGEKTKVVIEGDFEVVEKLDQD